MLGDCVSLPASARMKSRWHAVALSFSTSVPVPILPVPIPVEASPRPSMSRNPEADLPRKHYTRSTAVRAAQLAKTKLVENSPAKHSFHLSLKRPELGVLPSRIDLSEERPHMVLGRGVQAQCYIFVQEHPSFLSRAHAHILFKDNNWYIKDLLSINGTCVNLNKLHPFEEVLLRPGDHIYFVSFDREQKLKTNA